MRPWMRHQLAAFRMSNGATSSLQTALTPTSDQLAARIEALEAELADYRAAAASHRLFIAEYPYDLRSRPFPATQAGAQIGALCAGADPKAWAWLAAVRSYAPQLSAISLDAGEAEVEPHWDNGMIPALDGALLYAMVRELRPRTYLEVGSGNSTKFVRKAIRDGGLETRIVSIDPHPRAGIDALCDEVIRQPFEDVADTTYADLLQANDMVFIDNSHRSFPNSDVTVFFTETLAALPAGIIYGIHDIFLPADYPDVWMDRFYNEQYLLVAYLLGGAAGDQVEFAGAHVVSSAAFKMELDHFLKELGLSRIGANAGTFWMRRPVR